MEQKPQVSAAIRAVLRELGLTVVTKPTTPKPTTPKQPREIHPGVFTLAPTEKPVARIAMYHTQQCNCCGETETFYAGLYIQTSHSRWKCERMVAASLPFADLSELPLKVEMASDNVVQIPACFRCAATAAIIDTALMDCQHIVPRQGQLFS